MLIDITLANELPSLWVNLTKISHLVWRTCVKDPDTFPWLAHLYASQWIPIYILCRDCIDEINVFAAGSCGTERRHRTKIARDVKKADGRNCTLKWTLILPFRSASVTLSEVIASLVEVHLKKIIETMRSHAAACPFGMPVLVPHLLCCLVPSSKTHPFLRRQHSLKQVGHATLVGLAPRWHARGLSGHSPAPTHRAHQHVLYPELIWVAVGDQIPRHAANWFWFELPSEQLRGAVKHHK